MTFDEFKQKLPKKPADKFTARYYGTRALNIFPQEFLNYVNECSSFIDVTAGGGRFVYDQALKGKLIGANDRCFYSYCAMFAVLKYHAAPSDWLKILWHETQPKYHRVLTGYFGGVTNTPVNLSTRQYIDALCLRYGYHPFLLYCVGKAIRSTFTFRGLGWCPMTPFGVLSSEVSPEYIHNFLMRTAWTTYLYASRLEKKPTSNCEVVGPGHEVYGCDALATLKDGFTDELINGSLVYADPAWPWLKGSFETNPYRWLTEDLSSILLQRPVKTEFWPKKEEVIFGTVHGWASASLLRGAKYFVICNQDTNFPTLERTREFLSSLTDMKLVKWIEVEDQSKAAHRKYRTAWGVLSHVDY